MTPFGLYTEIEPTLERPDIFLALAKYEAEPEPYRDLLHFPAVDPVLVPVLAKRLIRLQLPSGIVPRLSNLGRHEDRLYLAFTLGPVKTAPELRRLRSPVPAFFWSQLHSGLLELHSEGVTYGHLAEHTVAMTDRGAPMLFDVTALRSIENQPRDVDLAALESLRRSLAR